MKASGARRESRRAKIGAQPILAPDMDQKILNDINERLRAVFAQSPAADLEKNLRALLGSFFARLDLVSRDEFDVQRQVLLRTREKLARLEAQVEELERTGGPNPQRNPPLP